MSQSCLRKVVPFKSNVSRDELRDLWKGGLVVGLFNLPNNDVFDACLDFAVECEKDELLCKQSELESRSTTSSTSEKFDISNVKVTSNDPSSEIGKLLASSEAERDKLKLQLSAVSKTHSELLEQMAKRSAELVTAIDEMKRQSAEIASLKLDQKKREKDLRQLNRCKQQHARLQADNSKLQSERDRAVAHSDDMQSKLDECLMAVTAFDEDLTQSREDLINERCESKLLLMMG
jgi:hypothetical protein